MPELPEIETVKLQLTRVLKNKTIDNIEVIKERSVHGNWDLVKGRKILEIKRRGKMLQIDLDDDISIATHFKMTGQLIYEKDVNENKKIEPIEERVVGGHPTADFFNPLPSSHTRAIFHFSDGAKMYFNDQRLFGWVKIGKKGEIEGMKFLEAMGPEPFDIDEVEFGKRVSKSKRPIKLVIMDQSVISGVGNIYANDALWEARVSPRRLANTLTKRQLSDLLKGIVTVLSEGIKYGGATAADAKYMNLHGMGGHYQDHYRVYERKGQLCLREDEGIVHKFVLGGRGTYFCPKCQK